MTKRSRLIFLWMGYGTMNVLFIFLGADVPFHDIIVVIYPLPVILAILWAFCLNAGIILYFERPELLLKIVGEDK